jgi:hypothetical protein
MIAPGETGWLVPSTDADAFAMAAVAYRAGPHHDERARSDCERKYTTERMSEPYAWVLAQTRGREVDA